MSAIDQILTNQLAIMNALSMLLPSANVVQPALEEAMSATEKLLAEPVGLVLTRTGPITVHNPDPERIRVTAR